MQAGIVYHIECHQQLIASFLKSSAVTLALIKFSAAQGCKN